MKIEFIAVQHINFKADNGETVNGYKAWYLDPPVQTANAIGTIPRSKWFTEDQARQFQINSPGEYDIEVNLNGRIVSCKKAK